jgi:hypothetical protein
MSLLGAAVSPNHNPMPVSPAPDILVKARVEHMPDQTGKGARILGGFGSWGSVGWPGRHLPMKG